MLLKENMAQKAAMWARGLAPAWLPSFMLPQAHPGSLAPSPLGLELPTCPLLAWLTPILHSVRKATVGSLLITP